MSAPTSAKPDADLPRPDVVDLPEPASAASPGDFLGHPRGLYPLFFTEMWERFSFYLMIALLSLYMTNNLGFAEDKASDIATWYMSLVYFTPFLGGLAADRAIGYVRAILIGGLLMMAGHIVLAFDTKESASHVFLFLALGLLILGNGLFKPNISTLVGTLYAPGDPRRDLGYTIFYMGINVGAFLAPVAANVLRTQSVGWLSGLGVEVADDAGWHVAFGSAGVGMLFSLLIFAATSGRFRHLGPGAVAGRIDDRVTPAEPPAESRGDRLLRLGQTFNMAAIGLALAVLLGGPPLGLPVTVLHFAAAWLAIEAVTVGIFLAAGDAQGADAAKLKAVFVVVALFWMAFHQNSVTLTFFADQRTQPLPADAPAYLAPVKLLQDAETYQAINPLCILAFSPLLVWAWSALARRGLAPSSTAKMALGMVVTALAYVVMFGAGKAGADTGKVGPGWLIGCYMLLTVAELLVSPIGLSLTSKLAPAKYKGLWMGFWFLATAVGNKLVHVTGGLWNEYRPSELFLILIGSSLAAAVALVVILGLLGRFGPASTRA